MDRLETVPALTPIEPAVLFTFQYGQIRNKLSFEKIRR